MRGLLYRTRRQRDFPELTCFVSISAGRLRRGWEQLISFAARIFIAVTCCSLCAPENLSEWRGRWRLKRPRRHRAEDAHRKRALQIAQRAEELAQRVGHPCIGLSIWASGVGAYLVGHWKRLRNSARRGCRNPADQCTGVTWGLTIANRFMLNSLVNLGRIAEVSRRVPVLLAAALEQGNIFAAMVAHASKSHLAGG